MNFCQSPQADEMVVSTTSYPVLITYNCFWGKATDQDKTFRSVFCEGEKTE